MSLSCPKSTISFMRRLSAKAKVFGSSNRKTGGTPANSMRDDDDEWEVLGALRKGIAGLPDIILVRGSVLDFHCERGCIVNAANEECLGGGGVDGAITSAGGPMLRQHRLALPILSNKRKSFSTRVDDDGGTKDTKRTDTTKGLDPEKKEATTENPPSINGKEENMDSVGDQKPQATVVVSNDVNHDAELDDAKNFPQVEMEEAAGKSVVDSRTEDDVTDQPVEESGGIEVSLTGGVLLGVKEEIVSEVVSDDIEMGVETSVDATKDVDIIVPHPVNDDGKEDFEMVDLPAKRDGTNDVEMGNVEAVDAARYPGLSNERTMAGHEVIESSPDGQAVLETLAVSLGNDDSDGQPMLESQDATVNESQSDDDGMVESQGVVLSQDASMAEPALDASQASVAQNVEPMVESQGTVTMVEAEGPVAASDELTTESQGPVDQAIVNTHVGTNEATTEPLVVGAIDGVPTEDSNPNEQNDEKTKTESLGDDKVDAEDSAKESREEKVTGTNGVASLYVKKEDTVAQTKRFTRQNRGSDFSFDDSEPSIRCRTGEAVITGPGDYGSLGVPFVVHAVGPNFWNYDRDNILEGVKLLKGAYTTSLDLAWNTEGVDDIAFCLLSAGIFRGKLPLEKVIFKGLHSIATWCPPEPEPSEVAERNVDEQSADDSEEEGSRVGPALRKIYVTAFTERECDILVNAARHLLETGAAKPK